MILLREDILGGRHSCKKTLFRKMPLRMDRRFNVSPLHTIPTGHYRLSEPNQPAYIYISMQGLTNGCTCEKVFFSKEYFSKTIFCKRLVLRKHQPS